MIKCPKCGFEQPKDVFCAQCGVNMSNYQQSIQSLVGDLKRSFKSLLLIVAILLVCYLALKGMGRFLQTKSHISDADITDSTQLGVGAGSLAGIKKNLENSNSADETAQNKTVPDAVIEKKSPYGKKEKIFRTVTATFGISEVAYSDLISDPQEATKKWHIINQANALNTFLTQEMTLHRGNNNFVYEDGVIRIDEVLNIEEISEQEVHARINYHRTLKVQEASGRNETIDVDQKIPISSELVILDSLPRRVHANRTDSILSTLFRSEAFLSRSSEMVQIIKFENPRASSQE